MTIKKSLIFLGGLILFFTNSCNKAPSIEDSFMFINGAEFNTAMLTPEGTLLGNYFTTVKNVVSNGDSLNAVFETHNSRLLLKDTNIYERKISFFKGCFFLSLDDLAEYMVKENDENKVIEETPLKYPIDMAEGDELPDAFVSVTVQDSFGVRIWTTRLTQRIVDEVGSKKCVAGNWKCYKISFVKKIYMDEGNGEKLMWEYNIVEWFSFDVGVIISQTFYPYDGMGMAANTELLSCKRQ